MDIKNEENADVKPDKIIVVKQEEQPSVDITVKEEKECVEKCNGETSDDVKPDENGRMECEIDMKESDDYDELNELISDEVKNGQDSANADKKLETLQIAIKQLYNDPSFAVVCSFFNKFACFLGIKPQNFNKLERLLTSFHETGRVDRELIDLHLTLLRKLNYKSARVNGWERYLLKYCSLNQSLESEYLNIERYGYLHSSINTKLAVLKTLCENQFDYNIKFKDSVTNSLQANELRLIAIGADINGLSYWYQQDYDLNIRIYSEEEDDHSGGTWNLIAKSKNELESLIEKLKSICPVNIKPEVLSKINENSEQENASLRCKRGILIDTFQSEASIKPIRKEMKCAKGKKKKMEGVKKGDDVDENKSDGSVQIPEELESFIDRRILPKRSARNAAITHLKQLTTPSGKKRTNNSANTNKTSAMRSNAKVTKSKQQVTSNVVTNSKRSEAVETEVASAENNNNNEDDREDNSESNESESDNSSNENSEQDDFLMDDQSEQSSSDDDFMPLCEIKKRFSKKNDGKKSRRRKKKKLDPIDMNEMDCDDCDELDDSDHEHVKKERKMATEETLCKHCAKSSNPEVLLLCDMCDEAWHTWCLKPLLWYVPDGDWFCPKCQHLMLINKLNLVIVLLEDDLKKKDVEDKRKEAAAERLKREMEYIGVSLNNIIPSSMEVKEDHSESSEESDVDDGERKSKKKANRLLNHHRRVVHPIVPIALGRSRRHVAKVDYKFGDYDNLIQEAMESIDETSTKQKVTKDSCRPQGGLGVGKDMANIINAENQRKSSMDSSTTIGDEKPVQQKSNVGKAPKSHRRLNNLDVDELTESDSEEYHASEESTEASDAISDDTDEYVPSDEARRRSTRRARSVDDFVVSGSEESEYEPVKKKPNKKPSRSSKRSRKRGRRLSTSTEDSTTEEETEMDLGEESDSEVSNKRRRQSVTKRRWAPHESSSDEEDDDYDDVKRTETGRPLRKAVVKAKKAEEEKSNEDDSMSDESKGSDGGDGGDDEQHPKSISGGKKRKRISSDEGDFEPDEEEVDEEEEEEEENATGEEDEQESDDGNKAECSTKPNANDETNKDSDEKKSDDKEEKCDESKQEKTKEEVSEAVNVSDTNKLSAQPEQQANSESETASPVATITAVKVEPVKTEELVNKVTPSVSQPSTSKTVMPTTISHPINYPVPCSSSAPSPAIVNDPSKVIQQMAKLATPIQSVPINATYPPPPHMSFQPVLSAHGSAPIHINNPYIAYSSHHKLPTYIVPPSATNIYGIRPGAIPAQTLPQTTYHLKAPPLIAPHYTQSHPTTLHSDQWSTPTLYSNTNNLFDTSSTTAPMMIPLAQPIIPIPATTSSANANSSLPDNSDSLGNVLASAMDY